MNTKLWVKIFKALGNEGRLKIMKLLFGCGEFTVTDISKEIGLSLKATSKHVIAMDNLGFVKNTGKKGHVYYSIYLTQNTKTNPIQDTTIIFAYSAKN